MSFAKNAFPGLVAAALLSASAAMAGSINVPNGSFEAPSAATPYGVSTAISNWTTYGDFPFDTGAGAASTGTGIFPNVNPDLSVNFSNADQSQVAFIFTKSGISTSRDGLEQILPDTFAAGKSYTLQIDLGLAGANPGATEPFTFNLFYYDPANPTTRNVVGGRTIYNDATTPLSKTLLTTLQASTATLSAGDPAIGKQIGIEIFTALGSDATVTAGKQYDFDNVRVNEVPEPATLTAVAGLACLMLGRRRRPQPGQTR